MHPGFIFLYCLRYPPNSGGNDWQSCCLRLDKHEPETLSYAREDEYVGFFVKFGNSGRISSTVKPNVFTQPKILHQSFEGGSLVTVPYNIVQKIQITLF